MFLVLTFKINNEIMIPARFITTNDGIQEIEQLHSEWSRMDNAAKLAWLTREKIHLNQMLAQMAQYIRIKGGFSNENERASAQKLLDMISAVDAEGTKVMDDIRNDAFKELTKEVMKHLM